MDNSRGEIKHTMHIKKSDILFDILTGAFFLIMALVSTCGFAYKFGYEIPAWTQWLCFFAMLLNFGLFGILAYTAPFTRK
jgi:hypothetical protein